MSPLSVLAVDDEPPALDELEYLLGTSDLVEEVVAVSSAPDALRHLRDRHFDVVLLDIVMPHLDGLELASVLQKFATPPAVVFVTAHERFALDAFGVGAAGYLLKPVDRESLEKVLGRFVGQHAAPARSAPLDWLTVDGPGRTTVVARSQVQWVESAGDYVRIHTAEGRGQLVRISMARLEEAWSAEGFLRIHRQYLISLEAVREIRFEAAGVTVALPSTELPVSRRHVRELRDRLVRRARGQT